MKNLVLAIVLIVFCSTSFYFGYNYNRSELVTSSDTLCIYDNSIHTIKDSFPYLVTHIDSFEVKVPAKFDTLEVIKKYFTKMGYERVWKDSNIIVTSVDTVYKNHITYNSLKYQWLKPTQIIKNDTYSTVFSRYVTLGGELSFPNNINPSVFLSYIDKKRSYTFRYSPLNKDFKYSIGVGFNVYKMR